MAIQGNQAIEIGSATQTRHLRVVTEADLREVAARRQAQWDALKAGYPAPVRLTKRGRRVVAALVLLPVAVFFWLNSSHGVAADDGKPTSQTIVVQPGQNLWDVAVSSNPNRDPREVVYEIRKINKLASSEVFPGQALTVPLVR